MQLPPLRLHWTSPRTWFVTARLLEVAAALMVLGSAFQAWMVFQTTSQAYGPNGEIAPTGPPFLDRVAMFAIYGFGYGQTPVAAVVACCLLLGVLAVLHLARPVSHAALLRWEVFSVWLAAVLFSLLLVLSSVVGLVKGDPNAPDDGTVTFNPGPGPIEQVLSGFATPIVCLLLLAVSALWWLRLPEEFDEPEDEPEDEPAREPRRWRPAPAQDANIDDLTLEGVEVIEPVERLHPRGVEGDGSTASGYDDYFRRF